MLQDKNWVFSSEQTTATTGPSTDSANFGAAADWAKGQPLFFVVNVTTAVASTATTTTVTFALQTATESTFSSPTTLFTTAAINKVSLTAKAQPVVVSVPHGAQQYLRAYYTAAGAAQSAGKVDAFLVREVETPNHA